MSFMCVARSRANRLRRAGPLRDGSGMARTGRDEDSRGEEGAVKGAVPVAEDCTRRRASYFNGSRTRHERAVSGRVANEHLRLNIYINLFICESKNENCSSMENTI